MFFSLESLILYNVKFNPLPRPMLCFNVIMRLEATFPAFYKMFMSSVNNKVTTVT